MRATTKLIALGSVFTLATPAWATDTTVLNGQTVGQIQVSGTDTVTVDAGGTISTASQPGILWNGDATGSGIEIENNGIITATGATAAIGFPGITLNGPMSIVNTGTISAATGAGIFLYGMTGAQGPITITNSGMIQGAATGIAIRTGAGSDTLNLTTDAVIIGRIFLGVSGESNTLNLSGSGSSSIRGENNSSNPAFIGWDGITDVNVNSGTWTLYGGGYYDNLTIASGATFIADDTGAFGAVDGGIGAGPSGGINLHVDGTFSSVSSGPAYFYSANDNVIISGSGTINLDTGAVVLAGANTFTGEINLTNSRVNVTGTLPGDVNVGVNSELWIGADLVPAGVDGGGDPIFDLDSDFTVATGSVGGNIDLAPGFTSSLFFARNTDSTYVGNVTGDGFVAVFGGAALTMTGDVDAFEFKIIHDSTLIAAGGNIFQIDDTFRVGPNSTAVLGSSGIGVNGSGATLSAATIAVDGTVYLDDNASVTATDLTLNAQPDMVAGAVSNVAYYLTTNTAQHGTIAVSGTATLGGVLGLHLDPVSFGASPVNSFTYDDLITAGTLTGTFSSVQLDAPSALYSASVSYVANTVDVTVTRAAFTTVPGGESGNTGAAAGAIEEIVTSGDPVGPDLTNVINYMLGSGDPNEVAQILNDLAGGSAANSTDEGIKSDDPFKKLVSERLNGNSSTGCKVGGPMWCHNQYASSGAIASDAHSDLDAFGWLTTGVRQTGATGGWGRIIGSWGTIDGDAGNRASETETYGAIVGVDHVFNPRLVLGAAAQYTATDIDNGRPQDTGEIENYQLGAYGSWGDTAFFINGNASAILHRNKTSREIVVGPTTDVAHASYEGVSLSASLELGAIYNIEDFRLQPIGALSYVHQSTDGYTETGAGGLSLIADGRETDSLRTMLGARLARQFELGGARLVPEARAVWLHELLDTRQSIGVSFVDAPNTDFIITSRGGPADTFVLGTGLTAPIGDSTNLFVDYDGAFNSNSQTDSLAVGFRAIW